MADLRLPPAEVLLAPDVRAGRVDDAPLPPLQPRTARVHLLQRDLVHAGQPVRLGISGDGEIAIGTLNRVNVFPGSIGSWND